MWGAVAYKLRGAEFFLEEMSRDLLPPEVGSPTLAAIASTGAIIGHPWQGRFYHHLDAFLAMARSIPDIVRCCFGVDPVMHSWMDGLDADEKARRRAFQSKFRKSYNDFKQLPLSTVRNGSLHRQGVPTVEVQTIGRWEVLTGGPLQRMPESETPNISAFHQSDWMYAATIPPQPVRPSAGDFWLVVDGISGPTKTELFPECRSFLEKAKDLVDDARAIFEQTHGSEKLTLPPAT